MDSKLLRIYQLQDGYCYNSDSLILFDFIKRFIKRQKTLLDVGAGSGILGLLCGRDFGLEASLVEQDLHNAFLCAQNARLNGVRAKIFHGDFFNLQFGGKFECIISNPPFYRAGILDSQNDKIKRARNEKFLPLESLCRQVKRLLHPKGDFIFCYDAKESHRVFATLQSSGFNAQTCRFLHPRSDKDATLVLIQAKIATKASLKILPPLFTHQSKLQTDNTPEVRAIYAACNTYSIKVQSSDICKQALARFTKAQNLEQNHPQSHPQTSEQNTQACHKGDL